MKMQRGYGVILLSLALVASISLIAIGSYLIVSKLQDHEVNSKNQVKNYKDCIKQPNSTVTESYPPVCRYLGQNFTEESNDPRLIGPPTQVGTGTLYNTPEGEYSFEIPDGWILHPKSDSATSFYVSDNENLKPKSGTKGRVEKDQDPGVGEFACGLYWDWLPNSQFSELISEDGSDAEYLEAHDGNAIQKTIRLNKTDYGYAPANSTTYSYLLVKSNNSINIGYTVCEDQEDYHEIIEQALKTIKIN